MIGLIEDLDFTARGAVAEVEVIEGLAQALDSILKNVAANREIASEYALVGGVSFSLSTNGKRINE